MRRLLLGFSFLPVLCGQARPEVSVSVRLTLAGAALGGAAWALSLSWAESLGLFAPPPDLVLAQASPVRGEAEETLLCVPLFSVPFR